MRGSLLEKLGTLVRTGVLGLWMLGVVLPMFWVLATSLKSTKEVTRSPFGIPDALAHPGAKTFAVIAENYLVRRIANEHVNTSRGARARRPDSHIVLPILLIRGRALAHSDSDGADHFDFVFYVRPIGAQTSPSARLLKGTPPKRPSATSPARCLLFHSGLRDLSLEMTMRKKRGTHLGSRHYTRAYNVRLFLKTQNRYAVCTLDLCQRLTNLTMSA
jgi:ABC-type glycerol-3-phosphate transport system permease component